MPTFRDIRAHVFKKMRIKPRRAMELPEKRMDRAFTRINATPEEAKAIIAFAKVATARVEQRKQYKANGHVEDDPVLRELRISTHKLLGTKRAEKFFDLCNDPYF